MDYTFLMCSERSGSNLLARMLGSHPDCCAPSPAHLIRFLSENRMAYGDLGEEKNWAMLVEDAVALFETKLGKWKVDVSAEMLLRENGCSLSSLLRSVFELEAQANGNRALFIKENHLYRYLPFLQNAFPGARYVYMVRDPRDMALSWKRSPVLRGCVSRAAHVWQTDQRQGIRAMGYLEEQGNLIQLTYEQLVVNPKEELARICHFMGLSMDPGMLRFYESREARLEARSAETWKNLDRSLIRNNFGKYRDALSSDEVAYIEAVCRDEMAFFGYLPETPQSADWDALRASVHALELHDKPGYANVSAHEKEVRRKREEAVKAIQGRTLKHADSFPRACSLARRVGEL